LTGPRLRADCQDTVTVPVSAPSPDPVPEDPSHLLTRTFDIFANRLAITT